jgi:hypothetical protein
VVCIDPSEEVVVSEDVPGRLGAKSKELTGRREDLHGIKLTTRQWDADSGADAVRSLVNAINTSQALR